MAQSKPHLRWPRSHTSWPDPILSHAVDAPVPNASAAIANAPPRCDELTHTGSAVCRHVSQPLRRQHSNASTPRHLRGSPSLKKKRIGSGSVALGTSTDSAQSLTCCPLVSPAVVCLHCCVHLPRSNRRILPAAVPQRRLPRLGRRVRSLFHPARLSPTAVLCRPSSSAAEPAQRLIPPLRYGRPTLLHHRSALAVFRAPRTPVHSHLPRFLAARPRVFTNLMQTSLLTRSGGNGTAPRSPGVLAENDGTAPTSRSGCLHHQLPRHEPHVKKKKKHLSAEFTIAQQTSTSLNL